MVIELGGFAEERSEIDGTEEEFNAFNYCLACDYIGALYNENFEEVGTIHFIFDRILYWYNYTKGLNNDEEVESLKNGTFITCNNRTIIDAILDKRFASLAYAYLSGRYVYSPKLVLAIILADAPYRANIPYKSQEDLDKKCDEFYNIIENEYYRAKDKKDFLMRLNKNVSRICIKKGAIVKPVTDEYNWSKALRNKQFK